MTARDLAEAWEEAGGDARADAEWLAVHAAGWLDLDEREVADLADVLYDRQLHGDSLYQLAVEVAERYT